MTPKSILIAGSGQAAELIFTQLAEDDRYRATAFVADLEAGSKDVREFCNLPVLTLDEIREAPASQSRDVIIAVGYRNLNRNRENFYQRICAAGLRAISYVHPRAIVSRSASIGVGSIIMAGSVIEPFAKIGEDSVIWSNCTIAHHSIVGSHCWVAAGTVISGHAEIHDNCFVGVGSTVTNRVVVDKFSIVGAGVVLSKNVAPFSVMLRESAEPIGVSSERYSRFLDD